MRIDIRGDIIRNDDKWIYDWLEMDATCPRDVISLIEKAAGERLDVYINSGGGDVISGDEIYAALNAYAGQVAIHVIYAGSAASIIAMAGHSDITPTGKIMIHNVELGARGDQHTMDAAKSIIMTANKAASKAYQIKTGKSEKELLAMMDASPDNFGTWLTADEAVKQGFIDKIAVNQNARLVASFGQTLPVQVIDKMRNLLINGFPDGIKPKNATIVPAGRPPETSDKAKAAQAKLKFLRLGGKAR